MEVLKEDNIITWWKSRGMDVTDAAGSANGWTIFLTVSGIVIGQIVQMVGLEDDNPGAVIVGAAVTALSALWGNSKFKKESEAILRMPPKDRVNYFSSERVMGAHVILMVPQINEAIKPGRGVNYKKRSAVMKKSFEELKKYATGYLKIAPVEKKDGYKASIAVLNTRIEEMESRIRKEEMKGN
jgi:hypothetical protein